MQKPHFDVHGRMIKEEGEVNGKRETFPLRIGKAEVRKGVRITRDKLEAPVKDGLKPQGTRVAGADDFAGGRFEQMAMLGEQRGAAKLASLDLLRGRTRTREAPERCKGRSFRAQTRRRSGEIANRASLCRARRSSHQ